METGDLLRVTSDVASSSRAHKPRHPTDDTPVGEAQGIWCGSSTITTPALASSFGWLSDAITKWLEEKVQSKSNIDALAGYGVDMDHPCVRVFAKEEVDANRGFLWESVKTWERLEGLKVRFRFGSIIPHSTSSCRKRHRRIYRTA